MGAIPALLSPLTMKIEQSVKRKGEKKNDQVAPLCLIAIRYNSNVNHLIKLSAILQKS
jgi:hypothetical protein